MISRALIKNQPGRRWLRYAAGIGLLGFTLGVAGLALAVHDLAFQLDGNTSTAAGTVPDATVQVLDWDSLFNADGTNKAAIDPDNDPGFTAGSFTRDFGLKVSRTDACNLTNITSTTFCTADTTTFATGSKDTLNISGWQCNKDNNVNSKIDIMNAYAAQYTAANGDRIMYFGLDKNKDNGNNNVGFWFLRGNANCVAASGSSDWTGTHQEGDILVVSAFTNGGGVSSITAYAWAGGATGCIDSTGDENKCDGLSVANGGDCKDAATLDDVCATTNSGPNAITGNITTTWLTVDATIGVAHTVVPPNFFEGGINLTKVLESSGGVPSCFNTFIADTRSSQSLTSTLFDYARGQLGGCTTTLTTAAGNTANGGVASPTSIGTGSVSSGTDTATLVVTGTSTWSGTLSWYLCGPVLADGCDRAKGVQVTSRTVSNASVAADFVSTTANLTSAGRYCWTSHFEPSDASKAAGLLGDDDDGVNECFTVAPVTPTLTTTASCGASPCVLGSVISDKAFLSGTASRPGTNGGNTDYPSINANNGAAAGGSITWVLYGPTNGGCTDTKTLTTSSVTVSGDNTTTGYGPINYTTQAADGVGVYTFVASYAGNSPNTNAATPTACPDPTDTEEVTVIGSVSSSSAQRWLPNDRIVLTSTPGTTITGTLTATLYSGAFAGTAANCTAGTATAVSGQQYTFNPSGASSPAVFNTTNTTFFVGTKSDGTAGAAAGTYFWLIHYVDAGLSNPTDRCETSTLSITD